MMELCPCGSEKKYENCCGALHDKREVAATPGALMRARYSAFVTDHIDYLMETVPGDKRETVDREALISWSGEAEWDRLKVIKEVENGDRGEVEFIAYYHRNKIAFQHHEYAYFQKIDGIWYYTDGRMMPETGQKVKAQKAKKAPKLIRTGKKQRKKR